MNVIAKVGRPMREVLFVELAAVPGDDEQLLTPARSASSSARRCTGQAPPVAPPPDTRAVGAPAYISARIPRTHIADCLNDSAQPCVVLQRYYYREAALADLMQRIALSHHAG